MASAQLPSNNKNGVAVNFFAPIVGYFMIYVRPICRHYPITSICATHVWTLFSSPKYKQPIISGSMRS
jgi:hypothetical protein